MYLPICTYLCAITSFNNVILIDPSASLTCQCSKGLSAVLKIWKFIGLGVKLSRNSKLFYSNIDIKFHRHSSKNRPKRTEFNSLWLQLIYFKLIVSLS